MRTLYRFTAILILLLAVLGTVGTVGAAEFAMKVMPAPPTPEADFDAAASKGWDVSVGYGHIAPGELYDANMHGVVTGVLWRGTIGKRFGISLAPVYAGAYFGDVLGLDASTWSVGSGLSFGSRILGRSDGTNLVLFGGGGYTWGMDKEEQFITASYFDYTGHSHLLGFAVGAKFQIAFHRFVKIIPFYVYMGGGGWWQTSVILSGGGASVDDSGTLDYQDLHLLGLDFNVFGVTAKLVLDLFREDYKSFTISVDVLGAIRGGKASVEAIRARKAREGE